MVARTATLSHLAQPLDEVVSKPTSAPLPVRTTSTFTASTSAAFSTPTFARTSSLHSTPPRSSEQWHKVAASPKFPASPSIVTPRKVGSISESSATSSSQYDGLPYDGETDKGDELDTLGYMYSLRVAALAQRLSAPPPNTSPSAAAPLSPPATITERVPASPMSFSSFRTPDPQEEKVPLPMRRRKSISYLRLKSKDELKLPREFLAEFWGVLVAERGDAAWQQGVKGFLALVQKKGYKTASGLSMREIPVLVDTFSSCLPQMGTAHTLDHQAHLLKLVYTALPNSAHFAGSTSDKDKDLLFRLRAEVQMHMATPTSPGPSASEFTPQLRAQGAMAKTNGLGLGLHPSPSSPISPTTPVSPLPATPRTPKMSHSPSLNTLNDGTTKRKPSPVWTGDGNLLGNLIEAVGQVWGVPHGVIERDFDEIQRNNLEKLYLEELKHSLRGSTRESGPSYRARHAKLSQQLADLLSAFPELAMPTSPTAFGHIDDVSYFTPPRKAAVFARLTNRVKANNSRRTGEVLKRCQEAWNVESRVDRERRVADLYRQWDASMGTEHEELAGRQLGNAIADLSPLVNPAESLPPPLDDVFARLKKHLTFMAKAIYAESNGVPKLQRHSPSIVPLFQSAPELFSTSPCASRVISELADDLKGSAVHAYVTAAGEKIGAHANDLGNRNDDGKDTVVAGFEALAEWIAVGTSDVANTWGEGLGRDFNPAAIIMSRQLPLFLAELQVLEGANGASSDVFSLYEVTSRVLALRDELCPETEHGFDVDAFFEPHIVMWLRETEANETHQWVTRSVAMDSWVPEGDLRHSQSVTELFELIRGATQTVRDLPLSKYKRSVFLVDLSRTASAAVSQYASTVQGLFSADIQCAKAETTSAGTIGGKASAWLAKGRHTVQKLDQKLDYRKRGVFVVPHAACVKLSNMSAANNCLDGLGSFLEEEETARILREHNLTDTTNRSQRQVFSVTVLRGQGMLTRGSVKPADAFVTVVDPETSTRLFKSRTVLETEDPKWEQTFEVSVSAMKSLELECFDRQLVGKHDPIGSGSFKLDPRLFERITERDVVVPLSPRGVVHLRISTEGREMHSVEHHLTAAARVLEHTGADMTRDIVDIVCNHIRGQLSASVLATVVKPLKDKKRGRITVSAEEVDASLAPVFDYLNETLAVFTTTMTGDLRESVSLAIWERIVDVLISLLIPPLSDKPYTRATLSPTEVDVVFKWLQTLKAFFNAAENGEELGIPISLLQAGGYRDMLLLGQCLDLPTLTLRERAAAAVRAASGSGVALRTLPKGTSSTRAKVDEDNERVAEVLLRIVRMRQGTEEFLETELGSLIRMKVQRS